jgi:DNA replication and repair protein RecF
LIRKGTNGFYIEASFTKCGIQQHLKIIYNGREKKIYHNDTLYSSASSLLGLLPGVSLTPSDSALVKGAPQHRRQFLDLQIAQVDPLYVHHLTRFGRAMRQRNHLLRARNSTTIESWEYEMAASASYLTERRSQTIEDLQEKISNIYFTLSGEKEKFELNYKTFGNLELDSESRRALYLELLKKMRRREMELGFTINGPQKDDFEMSIGQSEARYFASEGQQRTCTAALRIAEWNRLHHLAQDRPLILIDDFGIGLDPIRQQKLLLEVAKLGQVFLTTTQALPFLCEEQCKNSIFQIQNGKIQKNFN